MLIIMKQQSLISNGFEKYRKKTRKAIFLEQMNEILPWNRFCEVIEPFYYKPSKKGGRPPPLGLNTCCVFIFYNTGLNYQIRV